MTASGPVPIERLLEHRAWVRALARALVTDESRADDVAQDAWLAALRHPPRHDASIRAWLGRLVRHRASNARRADTRREAREQAPPDERPSLDPADAVARVEEHQRVVRAVLALPEPYRGTVVLRFYEDLGPTEIAARTGAPIETVRTRLRRAIEMLRGALDDEHGGAQRSRAALLLLVGGVPDSPWSALIPGGAAVTAKSKASLALVVLALLALTGTWAVLATRDEPGPGDRADVEGVAGSHAAPTGRAKPAEETAGGATADALPMRGAAVVTGRVRWADPPRPASGIEVSLGVGGGPRRTVVTDDRGAFRHDEVPSGIPCRVSASSSGFAAAVVTGLRLDDGETRDVGDLVLDRPVPFAVLVRDWSDEPIADAAVEVSANAMTSTKSYDLWTTADSYVAPPELVTSGRCDATGRATVGDLPPGRWTVVARAPGFAPVFADHVLTRAASQGEVLLRLDPAVGLSGRVVDRDAKPVAGLDVWASGPWRTYTPTLLAPRATTDASGRFRLDSLPAGDVTLLGGRRGTAPGPIAVVRVPTEREIEIVLGGGSIDGCVTCAEDGAPVGGARVTAWMPGPRDGGAVASATTDAEGRYRIDAGDSTGVTAFLVERAGFAPLLERGKLPDQGLVLEEGRATRDFVVSRGVTVSGRVVDEAGPVPRAAVAAVWSGKLRILRRDAYADDDGAFTVTNVAPGRVIVLADAPGRVQKDRPNWVQALLHDQPAGGPTFEVPATGLGGVEIRMEAKETAASAAPTGATNTFVVRGRVVADGADAVPPRASVEVLAHLGPQSGPPESVARAPVRTDGAFEVRVTRWATRVRVRAGAPGWTGPASAVVTVSADQDEVQIDATLHRTATVEGFVRAAAEDGLPLAGASLSVVPATSGGQRGRAPAVAAVSDAAGRFVLPEVAPGDHVLVASREGFVTTRTPFRAPTDSALDVRLPPGREIAGVVRLADGTPLEYLSVWLYRDGVPRTEDNWWSTLTDSSGRFRVADLPEGSYVLGASALPGNQRSLRRTELKDVAAGRTDVAIVVEIAREISGRVVGPDGAAIGEATVQARSESGDPGTPSAVTRPDGTFVLQGLAEGSYLLDVKPRAGSRYQGLEQGRALLGARVTGLVAGSRDVRIVLARGLEIRGTLAGPDGAPLAGAWIRAELLDDSVRDPWLDDPTPQGARSDGDGAFAISGLRPGRYRLALLPGPLPDAMDVVPLRGGEDVAAGASGVRVVAGNLRPISGVVVDESGAPVASARVLATPMSGGTPARALAGADGAFTIRNASDAASYRVEVSKKDLLGSAIDGVVAGSTGLRLVLRRGHEVSGRLVRADGSGAAGVSLRLRHADVQEPAFANTDPQGRFTVRGLREGTWTVERLLEVPNKYEWRTLGTVRTGDGEAEFRLDE